MRAWALLLWLTLASTAVGQEQPRVSISFAKQPSEAFSAIFGRPVKGLSVVQTEICNNSGDVVTIHAGHVFHAGQKKGLVTVSPDLVLPVALRTRRKSLVGIGLELAHWGSWAATVLIGADVVKTKEGFQAALPLVAQATGRVRDRLNKRLPDLSPVLRSLLVGVMQVGPHGCESRLLFVTKMDKEILFADIE